MKVLSFILQLGFCSLGTDYVCDNDDTEMSQVIQHFRELGLVFKRKGSSKANVINNDSMADVGDEKLFLYHLVILTFESVFIQPDYHYQYQYVVVQRNLELTKRNLLLLKQITVSMHTQELFYLSILSHFLAKSGSYGFHYKIDKR